MTTREGLPEIDFSTASPTVPPTPFFIPERDQTPEFRIARNRLVTKGILKTGPTIQQLSTLRRGEARWDLIQAFTNLGPRNLANHQTDIMEYIEFLARLTDPARLQINIDVSYKVRRKGQIIYTERSFRTFATTRISDAIEGESSMVSILNKILVSEGRYPQGVIRAQPFSLRKVYLTLWDPRNMERYTRS